MPGFTAARPRWSSAMSQWLGKAAYRLGARSAEPAAEDHQGGLAVSTEAVQAVTVADVAEVQSHDVFRIIGSTSHVVHFVGGGELPYAHNDRGQVIALAATGVRSEASPKGVVTRTGP